jgi:hypothetical protein
MLFLLVIFIFFLAINQLNGCANSCTRGNFEQILHSSFDGMGSAITIYKNYISKIILLDFEKMRKKFNKTQ